MGSDRWAVVTVMFMVTVTETTVSAVTRLRHCLVTSEGFAEVHPFQWAGTVPQEVASTPAAAPAADMHSSASGTSAVPVVSQDTALAKCNWTEHLSPEGFKYYYNGATGKSRWEKPEELTLFEQKKQQVPQTQSYPSILSAQQLPQIQQVQPQHHLQGQVLHQQQMQQPSLSSSKFQAYEVAGHQNAQELGYKQIQPSAIAAGDPGGYSQGIHIPRVVGK